MPTEVTDPDLLAQLNGQQSSARQEITDPGLLAQLNGQSAPPSGGFDNFLRQTALQGRAAAQGVVGALTLPQTLMTGAQNALPWAANKLLGTNYPLRSAPAQAFSSALTMAGAPTPQTSGEQLASAATSGVTGGLAGGGIAGMSGLNALRAGASGLTGSVSAEGARQVGLPPWMQFGAGLLGGQLPAMGESAAQTIGHLIAPVTSSGQARMAGMVLNEQASDPQAAIRAMQTSRPEVPGSLPTMGSASKDIGLMGVQKGLRSNNPVPFGERLSEQNTAQQTELGSMAGTPAQLEAAIKARGAATGPMYATAAADSAPIDNEMIALMQRPAMQKALATAQELAANKGQTFGLSATAPGGPMSLSGQDLQALKMALDDMKGTAFTQGIGSHQVAALEDTSSALKDWMQRNVPSQRAADAAFQQASGPINRMKSLQDLQQSAATSAVDVQTRMPFLSSAKFGNALAKIKDDPFSGVQSADMTRLEALQRDLQNQQVVNGPLLKAPASDTFQNFSINQNMLGAGGVGRLAMKPLDFLYSKFGVDRAVNEQLSAAALNPQTAIGLMRNAAKPLNQFDMYRLGNSYDLGTFFGLAGLAQR